MIGILFGFALLLATMFYGVKDADLSHFFQMHSFFIVVIGTCAILFLTFSISSIRNMFKQTLDLFKAEKTVLSFETEIRQLSTNKFAAVQTLHPLLNYAQQLWQQGVSSDMFIVLVSEKKTELDGKGVDVIHSLKNLAKYPPALGMVGTVMGMIELFSSLENNQDHIGQALSITMTATFLGLILSNLVISPLADRLHLRHMREQRLNRGIYELMLLINSNQPGSLINEEIKGRAA